MRKQVIILALIVFLVISIGLISFINRITPDKVFTGGSGKSPVGSLVLSGYNTPINSKSKRTLGSDLTIAQQRNIRTYLEAVLYEKEPLAEYSAAIVPGSITTDILTNITTFTINVKKPELTYTVTYNTLNDDMNVFDENNQSLRPTINPDGTPFKSFRTSSRLAR